MALKLAILGVQEAYWWLRSPQTGPATKYIVSIGASDDPGQDPPEGFDESKARKLRLDFWDVLSPDQARRIGVHGPTPKDALALIRFAKTIDLDEEGYLLCQCSAGISRSAACAYVILAVKYGPGSETEALKQVLRARNQADPNPWVVELASVILGRDLITPLADMMRVAHNPKYLV